MKRLAQHSMMALMMLALLACGRSRPVQFYILNPLPLPAKAVGKYQHLQIGIDSIETPAYAEKPQIMLYLGNQQVSMEEYHQWAESLDKTIKRVVASNLTTLLPGSVVANSPWDIQFKPEWHLQINISQFKIDAQGNSDLRANYQIYEQERLVIKRDRYYHIHTDNLSMNSLVTSMNQNLTRLTRDIANAFAGLGRTR
ncbi:PqiC family protein [Legionella sp. CNM-4043-24]|uniref:PqiC family protein n=1 Tax=Legionella sp. CNM-4043-24 TaxID=3421646 RepID=UPI00403A873A